VKKTGGGREDRDGCRRDLTSTERPTVMAHTLSEKYKMRTTSARWIKQSSLHKGLLSLVRPICCQLPYLAHLTTSFLHQRESKTGYPQMIRYFDPGTLPYRTSHSIPLSFLLTLEFLGNPSSRKQTKSSS
jgi:hypothetical protein